jgi:ribosome recycling factor
MTPKDILTKAKTDFEAVLEFYKKDIGSIRTSRATPSLVEDVVVEAYGQRMRIQELASMSVPEPRTLLIQPWDKGVVEAIVGAINKSDLHINPIVDQDAIRINIPTLTEERRKEFIKLLKKKTEEARIQIRQVREHAMSTLQKMEKDGEISEDIKFDSRESVQKMVDDYNTKAQELETKKEQELMQ